MASYKLYNILHRSTVNVWGYDGYDVAHWQKLYNVINRSVWPTISYTTAYIEVQCMYEALLTII